MIYLPLKFFKVVETISVTIGQHFQVIKMNYAELTILKTKVRLQTTKEEKKSKEEFFID